MNLSHRLNRRLGHASVVVGVVRHVATIESAAAGSVVRRHLTFDLRLVCAVVRVVQNGRHAPRSFVALPFVLPPVVEDLADALRVIAAVLEQLRQGHGIGFVNPKVRGQIPHSERVGSHAGEQRSTRGIAHGLLAVGAVENGATRGEAVDVRRLHLSAAVAAEFDAQVIDGNEENVRGLRNQGRDAEREE